MTETGTGSLQFHLEELERREKAAASIRDYQPMVIPGLLQTEAYAQVTIDAYGKHAIITAARRMQRQKILEDPSKSFRFVVSSAGIWNALGRQAGPHEHEVMQGQLKHLLDVAATYPHVRIQVLTFEDTHPASLGPFHLVDNWAHLETLIGDVTTEDPELVELLAGFFAILQKKALDTHGSVKFIEEALFNIS